MKPTLSLRRTLYVFALICILFSSLLSQSFVGVSSNPPDNNSISGASPVSVTPPGSMTAGDLVIIYANSRSTGITLTISEAGGQTWNTATTVTTGGITSQSFAIFWCNYNGSWSANPSVTGGNSGDPQSTIMYVYTPATPGNIWNLHVGPNNGTSTSSTVTITGITTTLPNTVTMAFWGSSDDNSWGTLTGTGWSKTGLSAQYRNRSGSDQSHTAAYNIRATAGAVANVSQAQTANGTDNTRTSIICWNEVAPPPPANDLCAGAIPLTSALSCVTTAGTLSGSSYTTISPIGCGTASVNDVWYSFVAQSTNPTITLTSASTARRTQLFSGTCGSLTSLACSGNNDYLNATGLTIGQTYYIRVYASTASTVFDYDICVTDPPYNDECTTAINLPIDLSCSNVPGNMAASTISSTAIAPCTGPVAYDVWYKFTAISASSTITLSGSANNFTNRRLQLFSGTCGSLTSLACGTNSITNATTAGTTYYVRIYSTSGPAPVDNATFNICVTGASAPLRFGNSYVNLSKKSTGGVVQTGDTLEIRMTVNHTSGTMYRLRYVDNIPTHTSMLAGSADSIRVITNEGLTFRRYTPAAGDDAATYLASPPAGQYNIRLNLSFGSSTTSAPTNNTSTEFTSSTGTMIAGSDRPRGGGGMLFAVAYRVKVTGVVGDTITLNPGQFIYRTSAGGTDITLTATPFKIVINDPLTLCANSIGVNNAVESGGTFGSGTTLNRNVDLATPISGYTFLSEVNTANAVGDGRYAIVKNLSPKSGTERGARRQNTCDVPSALPTNDPFNCNNRMFGGFWFVDGDHTGTSDAIGNVPPGPDDNGGYMLVVNADYVASEVYRQTITNLCPNTYYEFSAWIRNICPNCGLDSSGTQTFKPGVLPNLTFSLNDVDYYNTGEIDTLGWQKKGFVFKTGATQTNASFSIRNNSQGGGGNDWAMDDIAVATCSPNMAYSPSNNPNVCEYNALTIYDTIRSFYNNYIEYKWQKSTDGGNNWADIAGTTSTGTPVWNGTAYQYVTNYTIPPLMTSAANAGDLYRVVVATTTSNLGSLTCGYSDPTAININILTDCGPPLKTDLISVNGRISNNKAVISWVTSREDEPVYYLIERSPDGTNFTEVARVEGYNNASAETNYYTFDDTYIISNKAFYRVIVVSQAATKKYSRVIRLDVSQSSFSFGKIVNPFSSELQYDINAPADGIARIELIDINGKIVKLTNQRLYTGSNPLSLSGTSSLSSGVYLLKASINGIAIAKTVIKK